MKRLIAGIVIVVLGFGACFITPFIGMMGLMTQNQPYFTNQEDYTFTVAEPKRYKLYLVTSGSIGGQRVSASQSDLPAGMYGFRMADGTVLPLSGSMNETMTINNVVMESLGYAELTPGQYDAVVPESDQTFHFLASDFGVADMFASFGIGFAIMGVCLVAGIILIVTGSIGIARKRRENAEAGGM